MDVLLTETTRGAASTAGEALTAAGHRVHRCHDEDAPSFPCAGLLAEGCPLDAGAIDLVLTVRPHISPRPAAGEDGVACGLRRRIPVAVAGQTVLNPYARFGAEPVDGDLVGSCEQIAASRRPEHEAAALVALRDTLAVAQVSSESASVSVRRRAGRLSVEITVPQDVPTRVRELAAVRVVGRLRAFDRCADGIDVGVRASDDAP